MNNEKIIDLFLTRGLGGKFERNQLLKITYFIALGTYMFYKFEIINNKLNLLVGGGVIALLMLVLLLQQYTSRELMCLTLLLILSGIILYTSNELNVLLIVLLVFSSKKIDIDDILKFILYTYIVFFLFMLVANLFEFYQYDVAVKYVKDVPIVLKTYGFGHPNQISNRFFTAISIFLFLNRKKYSIKYILIACILQTYIYQLSLSRTGLLMFVFSIVIYIFTTKFKYDKYIGYLSIVIFFITNLISIIIPFFYSKKLVLSYLLDSIFTGRIRLASKFFEKYGINFFGQKLDFSGYDNVLDSSVPYIILTYGVVTYVILMYITLKLFMKKIESKNYYIIIYFVLFYFIGLSELLVINPSYNFTIFFYSCLFEDNDLYHLSNTL